MAFSDEMYWMSFLLAGLSGKDGRIVAEFSFPMLLRWGFFVTICN